MSEHDGPPLVSIVLPTYNGARYIGIAIASLLQQTYRNFEVIVVDGGSSDDTLEIVSRANDSRIKVVHQPNNAGRLPGALNLGFAQASGEYYTWIQDDDYFAQDCLQVLAAALSAWPDVAFVYAGYWWIDESGNVTRESDVGPPDGIYQSNCIGHCFMYRRSIAEAVGDYDLDYRMAEDFHYWLRIYKRGTMLLLPGRYLYHRWHAYSLTVRDYGRYESLRVCARARRQILGLGWLEYLNQLSAANIEEAFSAYEHSDFQRVRRCLARGLGLNPAWLKNRGVLSIGLESVVGKRLASLYRRGHWAVPDGGRG